MGSCVDCELPVRALNITLGPGIIVYLGYPRLVVHHTLTRVTGWHIIEVEGDDLIWLRTICSVFETVWREVDNGDVLVNPLNPPPGLATLYFVGLRTFSGLNME
jgi:hypothetical protein